MANCPHIPAKEIRGGAVALDEFMHCILAVPHSKIKAMLEAEKTQKQKSKSSVSRVPAASPKRAT